jgi:AraC-like DNA-binding protein
MSEIAELRPTQVIYFRLIVHHFGANASLRRAILDGTGICPADINDPQLEIYLPQFLRLVDNMERHFGLGWFLEAPELWVAANLRPMGLAAVTAPTLGAGLGILAKYLSVDHSDHRYALARRSDVFLLRHTVLRPTSEGEHRFIASCIMLALKEVLGQILGPATAELSYEFTSNEQPYALRLEKTLGAPVRWNAPANAMVVPQGRMAFRSLLADPVLHQVAVERLEEARRLPQTDGVSGRIERLLAHSECPRLPMNQAARALGLSPRTMTRRLAEANVTYRNLVDSELMARARRLLEGGILTQAEIADRLDFADTSSFSRACRRWFRADA